MNYHELENENENQIQRFKKLELKFLLTKHIYFSEYSSEVKEFNRSRNLGDLGNFSTSSSQN